MKMNDEQTADKEDSYEVKKEKKILHHRGFC